MSLVFHRCRPHGIGGPHWEDPIEQVQEERFRRRHVGVVGTRLTRRGHEVSSRF